MSNPNFLSRRNLLKAGVLAGATLPFVGAESVVPAAAPVAAPNGDPWHGLKVGAASYSVRNLQLDDAIKAIQRVGLKYVSIKNVKTHVDLNSTTEQRRAVAQKFRDAGITPLSCGNVGMDNTEASVRLAFEYARDLGVPTIVCSPHPDSMAILDKMVKEFKIRLAIHNHGPEDKRFPSPYDVWKAVEKYDERIGLCIDVGHTARAGVDPAEAIVKCKARLYDVHLKDISALGNKNTPIEAGRGILDLRAIMQALLKINYQHLVGFEYEKDADDPVPGLAETVGYTKGLLAGMKPNS
ncbi:MAG TPA: sugar phosphate isomerase/epimerase [Blastocatellia bacterium]|nr:sugar phosphate isomerase/epimerase [Blastocatellia bacterium]